MTLLLLVGLVLLAAAATLIVRAVFFQTGPDAVQSIEAYGFSSPQLVEEPVEHRRGMRHVDELAGALGEWASRRTSPYRESEIKRRLLGAGLYLTSPGKFFGYRVLLTVALPLAWLGFAALTDTSGLLLVLGFLVALACGWFGPNASLNYRTRKRHEAIDRELPELIDILVVTVEAGVAFTGALRVAAAHVTGPLGQELRLTLQEQAMGLATTEALKNTLVRADTAGMRIFVRAIVQGETLGVSIGQVMRNLAVDMRKRRRQAAEELAQKAPIKMLFPLVLLIFPSMFVVLLAPAMIDLVKTL